LIPEEKRREAVDSQLRARRWKPEPSGCPPGWGKGKERTVGMRWQRARNPDQNRSVSCRAGAWIAVRRQPPHHGAASQQSAANSVQTKRRRRRHCSLEAAGLANLNLPSRARRRPRANSKPRRRRKGNKAGGRAARVPETEILALSCCCSGAAAATQETTSRTAAAAVAGHGLPCRAIAVDPSCSRRGCRPAGS
jgi:hypothetical protein